MNAVEACREMLRRAGMSRYAASKAMGKGPSYMQAVMDRNRDMSVSTLVGLARATGYRVVLKGPEDEPDIEVDEEVSRCRQ